MRLKSLYVPVHAILWHVYGNCIENYFGIPMTGRLYAVEKKNETNTSDINHKTQTLISMKWGTERNSWTNSTIIIVYLYHYDYRWIWFSYCVRIFFHSLYLIFIFRIQKFFRIQKGYAICQPNRKLRFDKLPFDDQN